MTHTTTIYAGLFDQHTHTQLIETATALQLVTDLVLSRFGGATLSQTHGVYTHADGSMVVEPSLRVELLTSDADQVLVAELVADIKRILNQESVLLTRSLAEVSFV